MNVDCSHTHKVRRRRYEIDSDALSAFCVMRKLCDFFAFNVLSCGCDNDFFQKKFSHEICLIENVQLECKL